MAGHSNLVRNGEGGWSTCGCGGTPKTVVVPPAGSVALLIQSPHKKFGPVTGIEYAFQPTIVTIDIDQRDGAVWIAEGFAKPALPGYRGREARTGVVDLTKAVNVTQITTTDT